MIVLSAYSFYDFYESWPAETKAKNLNASILIFVVVVAAENAKLR